MSTNVSEIKPFFSSALNLLARWQRRCKSKVVINSFSSSGTELLLTYWIIHLGAYPTPPYS